MSDLKKRATNVMNANAANRLNTGGSSRNLASATPAEATDGSGGDDGSQESRAKSIEKEYAHLGDAIRPVVPQLQSLGHGNLKLYRVGELHRVTRETLGIIAVVRGEQDYANAANRLNKSRRPLRDV